MIDQLYVLSHGHFLVIHYICNNHLLWMDLGKVKLLIKNEHWKKKYYCHKHILSFHIYRIFFKLFETQYSMNPKIPIYYTWYKESARVIYMVKHCILPPKKRVLRTCFHLMLCWNFWFHQVIIFMQSLESTLAKPLVKVSFCTIYLVTTKAFVFCKFECFLDEYWKAIVINKRFY